MVTTVDPQLLTWSPSRLQLWDTCPARWFAKYIQHLPDPTSPPAAFGLAVHETLERVVPVVARGQFGSVTGQNHDQWSPAVLGLVNRVLTERLQAHQPLTDPFRDQDAAFRAVEQALRALPSGSPVLVEQVLVGRLTPSDLIQGRLDLVILGESLVTVRDWKTGWQPFPIGSSAQLAIYGLLAAQKWGRRVQVELHWLRRPMLDGLAVDDSLRQGAKEWLHQHVATIRAALAAYEVSQQQDRTGFPARPGSHCATCPVAAQCPSASAADPIGTGDDGSGTGADAADASAVPADMRMKAEQILVLERQLDLLKAELKAWYATHRLPVPAGDGVWRDVPSTTTTVHDLAQVLDLLRAAGYGPDAVMGFQTQKYHSWQKKARTAGHRALLAAVAELVTQSPGRPTFRFVKGGDPHATAE